MESENRNMLSVENLLEEARFEPAPAFREELYNRLRTKIAAAARESVGSGERANGYHNRRLFPIWQRRLAGALVAVAGFVSLVAFVPAVQAQVNNLLKNFGVQLPFAGAGLVISPFTPLAPAVVPEEINNFASLNLDTEAGNYIELRYFSQDTFIVIYETPAAPGLTFPEGRPVRIADRQDGVLTTQTGGMVMLAAPGPQPWHATGSGGGGGGGGGQEGEAPPVMGFDQAVQITWVQDGLWIEFLTNLPEEEALRLAGTLQPAPELLEK